LPGNTGGGNFPAHHAPTAELGQTGLRRIALRQCLRAAGFRQAVNAALILPILPNKGGSLPCTLISHGVSLNPPIGGVQAARTTLQKDENARAQTDL
jgi:hypothetical protein